MIINGYFIAAAKLKANVDVSRCADGFTVLANGHALCFKNPREERLLISRLARLMKKPVVGR